MITAILVVFLAIFGGALFLALLIWFVFRRRNSSLQNRNFSGNSNQAGYMYSSHSDNEGADFTNYRSNLQSEGPTAYDSPIQTEKFSSAATQNDYSPPPTVSYSESSSSYDSGGSSSDSGSSDSGSSSSSSD